MTRFAAFTHAPHTRRWLAVAALLLFYFLALNSAVGDSPTMDEQNHIARGAALWGTGDPRLSVEHPPFGNLLAGALPWFLLDLQLPLEDPAWNQPDGWYAFADNFLWRANQDVTRILFLARLPLIWLTLGLGLVGFHLARLLWGRAAALPALVLLLFDPNILAHGRYATTDVPGTFGILLALLLLWRLWRAPAWSWPRVVLAALGLGIAFGSKLSNLAFVPVFFALAALPPLVGARWTWQRAGRHVAQLVLAGAGSLLVLWALFAFEWGPFRYGSSSLPLLSWYNGHAGPMPTFWSGVQRMFDLGSDAGRASYLLGETRLGGFPAYFPVAFLVKSPLLLLLALPAALLYLLPARRTRRSTLFLLLPATAFFGLMLTNSLNIGFRHLLPIVPLLYVLVAGLAARPAVVRRAAMIPAVVGIGLVATALWIHPHYLSFFNLPSGGPARGYEILIDSNIDWGQDLLRLDAWLAERGDPPLKLGWFGTARPEYYGIGYEPLPGFPYHLNAWWDPPFDPANPPPGLYAISVSVLEELPLVDKVVYPYFRAREPDARIGYSVLIYEVPEP